MTQAQKERTAAGVLGILAGVMLMVALLASGWMANAEAREYWDGESHWLCFKEDR